MRAPVEKRGIFIVYTFLEKALGVMKGVFRLYPGA
jgi:hypothetical protein